MCFWLGASILAIGCRYVVSFDGLSGAAVETGSAAGSAGFGGNGLGGSTGGAGVATGSGGIDRDASHDAPLDVRPESTSSSPILVYSAPNGATIRGITVSDTELY